jgi:hypothetical protein
MFSTSIVLVHLDIQATTVVAFAGLLMLTIASDS